MSPQSSQDDNWLDEQTPSRPPLERPPFTLKEIRDAIPAHCFQRSLVRSFSHLFLDLTICGIIFYLGTFLTPSLSLSMLPFWLVYWYFQSLFMGGLWVLAHECGHDAFSDYPIVNETVGWILHSFLLVPFQSWRSSHRLHHLNAGSCDNDESFIPPRRSTVKSVVVEALEESYLYNFLSVIPLFSLAFFPFYLIYNFTGPAKYAEKNANHFDPSSVLFRKNQRNEVLRANAGIGIALIGIVIAVWIFGMKAVLFYYGIPYLIDQVYLVSVTLLHHTDTYVPHFRDPEWSWLRGALCTVDRSYGSLLDFAWHHIADTHVCHHLFSTMPFYHAVEATEAIKKVLGDYYLKDETPIWKATLRSTLNCRFVEDEGNVVFYKKSLKQL